MDLWAVSRPKDAAFAPHKGLRLISDRTKRSTSRAGLRLIPAVSLRLRGIRALPLSGLLRWSTGLVQPRLL